MKHIAAVLAGGSGQRFGGNTPKQFLELNGKPLIDHSIEVFQIHPDIDEIILVVPKDYIAAMEYYKTAYSKVKKIVAGGKERYQSSLAVIQAYEDHNNINMLLHDAARPMITQKMISDVIAALKDYMAVIVVVPSTDTIIQSKKGKVVNAVFNRLIMYQVQTPQGFRLSVLHKAFALALQDPDFRVTDDGSVVFNYLPHEPVAIVKGDPLHTKITYPHDFKLMEVLLRSGK